MNKTEHLELILTFCRKNLALAEKRTPGEWLATTFPSIAKAKENGEFDWVGNGKFPFPSAVGSVWSKVSTGHTGLPGRIEVSADNARFIALCAGAAEAGWRATIAAIEGLISARDGSIGATHHNAVDSLSKIIAAYPLELLNR